jgi:hypothetical protein
MHQQLLHISQFQEQWHVETGAHLRKDEMWSQLNGVAPSSQSWPSVAQKFPGGEGIEISLGSIGLGLFLSSRLNEGKKRGWSCQQIPEVSRKGDPVSRWKAISHPQSLLNNKATQCPVSLQRNRKPQLWGPERCIKQVWVWYSSKLQKGENIIMPNKLHTWVGTASAAEVGKMKYSCFFL